MAKHQRHIKILGIAVGSLCTAHVGSCYHRVGELEALYVWDEHRRGIEVVYRHIEKPLDLVCVQVHGNYTVYAGCDEHVGNKLGGDRHTRLILAVLTGPAEVRHHGDNRFCRGALGSVNHKEQFHKIVAVREGTLYEVHLTTANRFFETYFEFTVGEVFDFHRAEFDSEFFADFFGHIP
jgi:hypothetical protein